MKKICFRFDVDTHACLSKGMPNLLALAEDEGVVFTFFINMGKGFDRLNSIKNILGRFFTKKVKKTDSSLSMFTKLGRKESLVATFLNPFVGKAHTDILVKALESGHELGLHGGKNHAHWEKRAAGWSYKKLLSEVYFGLKQFENAKLPRPTSFASPAWNSPSALQQVLKDTGFSACADVRNSTTDFVDIVDGLAHVSTNILSPVSEVGFIENQRAIGLEREAILSDFKQQLLSKVNVAMVYEHPFYAGVHEIELLRDMIKEAKNTGFTVATIKNIMGDRANIHTNYFENL